MVVTVERVIYVADGGHMESRIMDAGLPTFPRLQEVTVLISAQKADIPGQKEKNFYIAVIQG